MDQPFPEKTKGKPRVLVAPLDWGLGHATRCIPVIKELLAREVDVWLAGEGAQEQLLKMEFPLLPFLELPGYRIKYAKTKKGLIWKMLRQGPKMRIAIGNEHRWLKKMVKEHDFDAVISDNRFGLHHEKIPCIFITHQLRIKSSAGKWTEKLLQKRNYNFINRFTACWIPDTIGHNNLSGDLSHPSTMPGIPVHYLGWLSRFEKKNVPEKKNYILVILSGPEPQRGIFEEKIIEDISHYNGQATVLRGLPGSATLVPSTGMIHFYNHLPADILNDEMQEAEYIICRTGYSSVMDIVRLGKKTVMVPTPGQTEQEYLGKYLAGKNITINIEQKNFQLTKALELAGAHNYELPVPNEDQLGKVIDAFCLSLPNRL